MKRQVYIHENVVNAAKRRISDVFDEYEEIFVSVSGGKDSTVLAHLVATEAQKRGRRIKVFFLDEEVDYEATIDQVKYLLFEMMPETIVPVWYQFPFHLTNATSMTEGQLIAWEPGKHKIWMRSKDKRAVHNMPWRPDDVTIGNKLKGFGFYDVIRNVASHRENTCFFVGLRAVESPNRWQTVSKNPGKNDWCWTTKGKNGNINAYPIYDWNFGDVWKYIYDNKLRYNKIYDWMWKKGMHMQEIRVSSLIHEKSFKALVDLPEFEPKTYNKLTKRIKGIQTANLYGKNSKMMKCRTLPKKFKKWAEYRDFLLDTYPDQKIADIFRKRFERHLKNEYVARQQCRQIVLGDYENNLPVKNTEDPREETIRKWMAIL